MAGMKNLEAENYLPKRYFCIIYLPEIFEVNIEKWIWGYLG